MNESFIYQIIPSVKVKFFWITLKNGKLKEVWGYKSWCIEKEKEKSEILVFDEKDNFDDDESCLGQKMKKTKVTFHIYTHTYSGLVS